MINIDRFSAQVKNDIIGQSRALNEFMQSISSGKMAQSWIFVGPKGVGKRSFAQILSRELLASSVSLENSLPDIRPAQTETQNLGMFGLFGNATTVEAASIEPAIPENIHHPDHPAFRKIEQKTHPDFLSIELDTSGIKKKNELGVDEIREVSAFLRGTSSAGGWRIVIIDDAECMNKNAANALLKILEEPPEKSMIILIASTLGYFPPTIRSRCRMLPFLRLDNQHMRQYMELHHPGVPASDQQMILELASGSIGQLNQIISADGMAIYRDICQMINLLHDKKQFWPRAHNLAEKMEHNPNIGPLIYAKLIELAIFAPHRAVANQNEPAQALSRLKSVPQWMDYYAEMQHLVARQQFLYLDPKQCWLNLFSKLAA